ncbi:unnamed protein product [Alopecurus aequalis]
MEIASDCHYHTEPVLVTPSQPTPGHTLYLSNIDDQLLLRFSVEYLFVFTGGVDVDALRGALSRVLVDYYPLAGRLRPSNETEGKLVVDCNAEGALFGEGFLAGLTAAEFLRGHAKPHESWRKLLHGVEPHSFVGVPPLVVQVTHLGCGGTILCTAISHCLCDGIGAAHFLHSWARAARSEDADPLVLPAHDRHVLRPHCPPCVGFKHPAYSSDSLAPASTSLFAGPLAPVSLTFTAAHVQRLKKRCVECTTSFEALAAHVLCAWVRSLDDPPSDLHVKLLFTVNVRRRVKPELPGGYYGNGIAFACAESTVGQLMVPFSGAHHHAVSLVQAAKESVGDDYVRSTIDLLELRRDAMPDLAPSLVISAWTWMGLEDLDFGTGRPVHVGPLTSEIYCLFLPVVGDANGIAALVSVPEAAAERFEHWCLNGLDDLNLGNEDQNGDLEGQPHN